MTTACERHQAQDAVWCQVTDHRGDMYVQLLCARCIDELRGRSSSVLVLPKEVDDAE